MADTLLIFDCDGVLVESEAIYIAAELEFLSRAGMSFDRDEYIRRFMGLAPDQWEQRLAEEIEAQLGHRPEEGLFAQFNEFATQKLKDELVPVEGARSAIRSLDGVAKCVASSSSPKSLRWKLGHTDLIDLFDPHLFSTQLVENGKPAPDLFLLAAERMSVAPAQCIVIEDSSNGVMAGKRAGMKVIGFTAGSHCPEDHGETLLADGADVIIDSYEQLSSEIHRLGS